MMVQPDASIDISEAQIEAFQLNGAVCLRGIMDASWLELLREGVERNLERPSALHTVQTLADEPGFFLSDICMAQEIGQFREFILNGPAAELGARLMRSQQASFWADTLWVKHAGTPKRTRWHQDQPFFWVDGQQMCVIWWPLDPVARGKRARVREGFAPVEQVVRPGAQSAGPGSVRSGRARISPYARHRRDSRRL